MLPRNVFTVVFTQAAREELIEAQDWYEGETPGLGRRFREAIDALAERMSANPRQFPVVFKSVRRALLPVSLTRCFLLPKNKPYLSSPAFMPAAILCNGSGELESAFWHKASGNDARKAGCQTVFKDERSSGATTKRPQRIGPLLGTGGTRFHGDRKRCLPKTD